MQGPGCEKPTSSPRAQQALGSQTQPSGSETKERTAVWTYGEQSLVPAEGCLEEAVFQGQDGMPHSGELHTEGRSLVHFSPVGC